MRRRLSNLAGAISLVVCVAMIALWIRSYFKAEWIVREDQGWWTHGAWVAKGQIVAYKQMPTFLWKDRPLGPGRWTVWHLQANDAQAPHRSGKGIVGFDFVRPQSDWSHIVVVIPLWFTAASAGLVAAWLLRTCRRSKPGACGVCGYDLRATVERCPECGTVTNQSGIAAA